MNVLAILLLVNVVLSLILTSAARVNSKEDSSKVAALFGSLTLVLSVALSIVVLAS